MAIIFEFAMMKEWGAILKVKWSTFFSQRSFNFELKEGVQKEEKYEYDIARTFDIQANLFTLYLF